jgi:DNA repair protein RecO (recombination protein O)
MNIERTTAFVLHVLPYRESSSILHLFTRSHGMVHGIAKGVLKPGSRQVRPERGLLVEVVVYLRPSRDLHILGDLQLIDYYSTIRGDLYKTAFRDCAFEMLLKAVTGTGSHPEVFELLEWFITVLQHTSGSAGYFPLLWRYFVELFGRMGFGMDPAACAGCGVRLDIDPGAFLAIDKGGFLCARCAGTAYRGSYVRTPLLRSLEEPPDGPGPACCMATAAEYVRFTRLLASYGRYHFDIRSDLTTLDFIEEMMPVSDS